MSTYFFDFSKWDFYDAPLKSLTNVLQINQEFRDGIQNGFVGGLTPERYNKIAFVYRTPTTGWITSEYFVEGENIENQYFFPPIACGATARPYNLPSPTATTNYMNQPVIDPVFYCTIGRVKEIFTNVEKLVEYNPYFIGAGQASVNQARQPASINGGWLCCKGKRTYDIQGGTYTTAPETFCIDKIPDIGDWIIVKTFQCFDVNSVDNYPRSGIGSPYSHNVNTESSSPKFVAPVVPYVGSSYQSINMTLSNYGKQKILQFGNAIFVYNPAAWCGFTPNNYPLRSFGSLGMSSLFDCYYWTGRTEQDVAGVFQNFCTIVPPKIISQTYPNDMILLGEFPTVATAGLSLKPINTGENIDEWALPNYSPVYIAFRSWKFVEQLSRDFGIYVTTDLDTARNTPIEYFPDIGQITPDPTIPPTGFQENPINPNIPNFPDNTTDIIERPIPNITPISVANVYALNIAETKAFFNWLLTDDFIKNISELFNDKLSAINDIKLLPFDIVAHDPAHTQSQDSLTIANVTTSITNFKVTSNYNSWIFGGEYQYTAYWGDFNDYESTSFSLYVPYAGIIDLSPSDVINKTLQIWYAVDLNTGNSTAVIYSGNVAIRTIGAQMSISVPVIASNVNEQRRNEALTAINVGNSIAHSAISTIATGNPLPLVGGLLSGVANVASTAMNNPYQIQRAGTFSSSTSLLMIQTPFLIISRQQIAIPDINYKNIAGIPSSFCGKISQFIGSGFISVKVDKIATAATENEQNEIRNLLVDGIFI